MPVKMKEKEASLIRESLELEKKIIRLSLKEYTRELQAFEKRYGMKTKQFLEKFNSGKLGDEGEWFDWLFVSKAFQHVNERLKTASSISV